MVSVSEHEVLKARLLFERAENQLDKSKRSKQMHMAKLEKIYIEIVDQVHRKEDFINQRIAFFEKKIREIKLIKERDNNVVAQNVDKANEIYSAIEEVASQTKNVQNLRELMILVIGAQQTHQELINEHLSHINRTENKSENTLKDDIMNARKAIGELNSDLAARKRVHDAQMRELVEYSDSVIADSYAAMVVARTDYNAKTNMFEFMSAAEKLTALSSLKK